MNIYFFDSNDKAIRMYSGDQEDFDAMCKEYQCAYFLESDKKIPLRNVRNVNGTVTYVEIVDTLNYQQKRAIEYPRIADQLDMIWHAMDNGTTSKIEPFYSTIKFVKDKYPKD